MTNYALGIHTATPELVLGITDFTSPGRYQTWALGRDLSVYLHEKLREFLPPQTWKDLKYIVVARGPGSFTGTRMGVVTARTLAQQLELPLFAISTLAATAQSAIPTSSQVPQHIAVELPAQQGQVYGAIYKFDPLAGLTLDGAEQNLAIAQWQQLLADYPEPLLRVGNAGINPDMVGICRAMLNLAEHQWQKGDGSASPIGNRPHWSTAIPFYS